MRPTSKALKELKGKELKGKELKGKELKGKELKGKELKVRLAKFYSISAKQTEQRANHLAKTLELKKMVSSLIKVMHEFFYLSSSTASGITIYMTLNVYTGG